MAEILSPKPKQRGPFSPVKSPFAIGSNDDKLERAQARAARAAAVRRKAAFALPTTTSTDPCLGKEQILELFHNCIKLASENKINQKNTWELNLIDHLNEIIKVEEETDAETNFQKASCTLEAGVKIYSMRVDSVHSEAYKVLGGINRAGQEDEKDDVIEDAGINTSQGEDKEKEQGIKLSPLSTLESSPTALNVKKLDVAFVVDPLYHQTSAQFDEGGAKGLLLHNLGVYGNCRILFDSMEVPGKCAIPFSQHEGTEMFDLSFASECIEQMVLNMRNKSEITPTLRAIVNQLDEHDQRPSELHSSGQSSSVQDNGTADINEDLDGDSYGNHASWDFDNDDQGGVVDEGNYGHDAYFSSQPETFDLGSEQINGHDPVEDELYEDVDGYLFSSLGFSTKQNAWAGPDHWKYRKAKDVEVPQQENGPAIPKKTKTKKAQVDIEFSSAVSSDFSHIFAPPKNPKSLLMPAKRASCNTKLPEDCHYQPEDLVKLFLLPNMLCLGKGRRKRTDDESQQKDGYDAAASWVDEDSFGAAFDEGHDYSDAEESTTLVSQPRQVSKIEVQYDKTSKQVDVHALKETLWDHMQQLSQIPVQDDKSNETISFKQVLASFPDSCRASSSINDISPHLCFICLLHLANEHGLAIHGSPGLDDLIVNLNP